MSPVSLFFAILLICSFLFNYSSTLSDWKCKIIAFYWQLFTVSLAAQVFIIPLTMYYFHQFPGLFFISNLAIIPFLGVILGLGIVVIGLSLINLLPSFLVSAYGTIISKMNELVGWVAAQESFLFRNISFDHPIQNLI